MTAFRTVALCGLLSIAGWSAVCSLSFGFPPRITDTLSALTLELFPEAVSEAANGFGYDIENQETPTAVYLILHFALFGLAILPIRSIRRFQSGGLNRRLLALIFAFATLFRLILLPSTPIHENDFYRYLWDGKSISQGVNPYLFPPADVAKKADPLGSLLSDPLGKRRTFEDLDSEQLNALNTLVELRAQNPVLHARIGHPHIPTIYPPASQASFWINDLLTGGSVLGWKTLVVVFDLGCCAIICLLLFTVGRNPAMVILYAWNPLVLKEFANSGHHDSIPIFFTLLAIAFAVRGRRFAASFLLAIGTLGKFLPVVILPILSPPSLKVSPWLRFLLFSSVIAIAYLPFLLWQNTGFDGVFSGLHTYNQDWEFFAGAFALVRQVTSSLFPEATLYPAKVTTGILFVAIVAYVTLSTPKDKSGIGTVKKCSVIFGAFFILNATAFPWYFAWVMPFLCFFPNPAWIALGGLLPLSYLSFHPPSDLPLASAFWHGFPAISWIIWGGFAFALVASWHPIRRFRSRRSFSRESA